MRNEKRKILITGGAGMIGQEVARQLPWHEWAIHLHDDFSNPYTKNENLVGELTHSAFFHGSPASYDQLIREINPDVISHQASLVSVGRSMYDPALFFEQNVQSTAHLIQAIFDHKWRGKLILGSSMGVYGEGDDIPVSFYGQTKKMQEEMLRLAAKTYGFELVILRYFSVYSTRAALDNPYTGIIPLVVQQALLGDKITMYGDGNQTRDMIDVRDVAKIHNDAIDAKYEGPIDVRTGITTKLSDIVKIIVENLKWNGQQSYSGDNRQGDICLVIPTDRTFEGCRKLEDGIREYIEWLRRNPEMMKVKDTVAQENENIKAKGLVN